MYRLHEVVLFVLTNPFLLTGTLIRHANCIYQLIHYLPRSFKSLFMWMICVVAD